VPATRVGCLLGVQQKNISSLKGFLERMGLGNTDENILCFRGLTYAASVHDTDCVTSQRKYEVQWPQNYSKY